MSFLYFPSYNNESFNFTTSSTIKAYEALSKACEASTSKAHEPQAFQPLSPVEQPLQPVTAKIEQMIEWFPPFKVAELVGDTPTLLKDNEVAFDDEAKKIIDFVSRELEEEKAIVLTKNNEQLDVKVEKPIILLNSKENWQKKFISKLQELSNKISDSTYILFKDSLLELNASDLKALEQAIESPMASKYRPRDYIDEYILRFNNGQSLVVNRASIYRLALGMQENKKPFQINYDQQTISLDMSQNEYFEYLALTSEKLHAEAKRIQRSPYQCEILERRSLTASEDVDFSNSVYAGDLLNTFISEMKERKQHTVGYHERAQSVYGVATAGELPTAYRIAICLFAYLKISKAYGSVASEEGKTKLELKGSFGFKSSLN